MPDAVMAEFTPSEYKTLSVGGCEAVCSVNGEKCTVQRLISTDPSHYINPAFAPGSVWDISLENTSEKFMPVTAVNTAKSDSRI